MNCPSRTDHDVPPDWNQNPNALCADATTRSDLSRIANARIRRDHKLKGEDAPDVELHALQQPMEGEVEGSSMRLGAGGRGGARKECGNEEREEMPDTERSPSESGSNGSPAAPSPSLWRRGLRRVGKVLLKYAKFVGPGFMVSVAYIDPGNYATDVAAGASYRFKLLFMVLLSNLFAIFLQSLCIKLGSVTGLNLAEMCRAQLPRWLNYTLYVFAEAAIIATDIAEVIGTAIALNLLLHIPLVAGCAISIVDVLFILLFYQPQGGNMKALRAFEFFVMLLVLGVVICFCSQLSLIKGTSVREVFKGYLPSRAVVEGPGLYQACGILGATVMPHSLYLGSGIIQARLKDFDDHHPDRSTVVAAPLNDTTGPDTDDDASISTKTYRPSISAIRSCMSYSIAELAISLFTFALFVNSAILIVAGSSLSNVAGADNADLFDIHRLLSHNLAPAAATVFALALLLSGTSAGIVCTIAGQMVSEGQLSIAVKPWVRRLMTRSISITPSIIIAGAVGKDGLSAALEGSQVALSVILPFVSAPLIYFTCRNRYMTVGGPAFNSSSAGAVEAATGDARFRTDDTDAASVNQEDIPAQAEDTRRQRPSRDGNEAPPQENGMDSGVKMRNGKITATVAILIWAIIVVMNVALLVLLGLGKN